MRDATTPPPARRIRTPPAPKHGARYDNYEPYTPRRSQRVKQQSSSLLAPKSTLQRTSSSQTLSPPSSPVAEPPLLHQTPARSTPVRHSLFTRNRPSNSLFGADVDPRVSHNLPTPSSIMPTPRETPRKRDVPSFQSTARILNFKPASTRKRVKSRLDLDEHDDMTENNFSVFTDVQDRIPRMDATEDNPFVGPRATKSRSRAQTAPVESHVDDESNEEGILYVFRGKKIFRRFDSPKAEATDSDASATPQDSLKRKAGAAASRPLTRSTFKPRLLWPAANSDNDADEEALTDIEDDNMPTSVPASFTSAVHPAITPAKKAAALFPATPPSSHRQTRASAIQLDLSKAIHQDSQESLDSLASPSATPIPNKAKQAAPYSTWLRTKSSERGEKRSRVSLSESELPSKRNRSEPLTTESP